MTYKAFTTRSGEVITITETTSYETAVALAVGLKRKVNGKCPYWIEGYRTPEAERERQYDFWLQVI